MLDQNAALSSRGTSIASRDLAATLLGPFGRKGPPSSFDRVTTHDQSSTCELHTRHERAFSAEPKRWSICWRVFKGGQDDVRTGLVLTGQGPLEPSVLSAVIASRLGEIPLLSNRQKLSGSVTNRERLISLSTHVPGPESPLVHTHPLTPAQYFALDHAKKALSAGKLAQVLLINSA